MSNQQSENTKAVEQFSKTQIELSIDQFKRDCRKVALASAERLNPQQVNYSQALGASQSTKATVEQVLKDADKIYEWLTKEL